MLIPLQTLQAKYNFNIKGIIHVGASTGQEMPIYAACTDGPVVFVEAIPEVYRELERRMRAYPQVTCLNACITDVDGEQVTFNVSNNEMQSSSLFEFGTHTIEHPTVRFERKINLQTTTLRSLFAVKGINLSGFDFLNLDIQGAELMALKSMDLSGIKYAYVEVNEKPLYHLCPLIGEIDSYLAEKGFRRVETHMTPHGWGDAFYIREETKRPVMKVPAHFQPFPASNYPTDNTTDFEHWYWQNYTPHNGRTYLPIMWTAYYCRHKYGKDAGALAGLQNYLNGLDRSVKYYTIVQYDDGILNDISQLDIMVYSMSGHPINYPLPLICMPHEPLRPTNRDIFASFVGRMTHPVRESLKLYTNRPGWFIAEKTLSMTRYCDVLNRSTFTLCPRGYGPTSFRIVEALQFGSIPVYISDQFIEPHNVPFDLYGVLVHSDDVNRLPDILSQVDVAKLQEAGKAAYESFYTYQVNKEIIDDHAQL